MTYRIAWLTPFTGASGVGTFSHAVTRNFPRYHGGEAIDLTILHPAHTRLYGSEHRCIQIEDTPAFHRILPLFDLLIYNIGNNCEHHALIFKLLEMHPGIVICHDYVFQHYLARRSMDGCNNFSSYGALLTKYGDAAADSYIRRSRITSRGGGILYSPWDSEYSVTQPLSEVLLGLGSALVLHSAFAFRRAEACFSGPVIQLGMPYDQKRLADEKSIARWSQGLAFKRDFHLVSFGHIQSTKCIDAILEAIAASGSLRQKIRYTIAGFAGDKAYYSELQNIVAARSLREIVTFETDVSEARLDRLMDAADIFINLRRPNTEGSSASVIEQLETGKPVIVLDSGSYGEIPDNAAVKLPEDAGAKEIKAALETLVANSGSLAAIGQAGRAHARSWSCASYADRLLRFVFKNHDLLQARGRVVAAQNLPVVPAMRDTAMPGDDPAWLESLARARRSLNFLDRNMLALDPELIMGMKHPALCTYVAEVIFGVFGRPELAQALSEFFTQRDGAARYWACAKFMLIADAVFDGDEAARQRLLAMPACFESDFWAVMEQLPPARFLYTARLLLHGGPALQVPDEAEDIPDATLNRLAVLDLLETLPLDGKDGVEALKRWLAEPPAGPFEQALPVIDRNLGVEIGSADFRDAAALWGFHRMEADHAWMRGRTGFIGLKLSKNIAKIALLVRHIHAGEGLPCSIALSGAASRSEIEIRDGEPHWITLTIRAGETNEDRISWLRIVTSHAAPLEGSADPRVLGCCVLRLEVSVKFGRRRVDLEKMLLSGDAA